MMIAGVDCSKLEKCYQTERVICFELFNYVEIIAQNAFDVVGFAYPDDFRRKAA